MDDQQANCILGVCCCEENCAEKRRKALSDVIVKNLGPNPSPQAVANLMLNLFDFARKGTLEPLYKDIAALARGPVYQG